MIVVDFECTCGHKVEDFVSSDTRTIPCEACGGTAERLMSAPRVGLYNDPAKRSEILKTRSLEHSLKESRKNPEAIAKKLGGKPKVQTPWNIRKS